MEAIGDFIGHFVSILRSLDWMQWLLLWFLSFIPLILWLAHSTPGDGFDLRHLIAERENEQWHISLVKFTHFSAFLIASWVFLYFAQAGKLTEPYFWGYMLLSFAPKTIEKYIEKMGAK